MRPHQSFFCSCKSNETETTRLPSLSAQLSRLFEYTHRHTHTNLVLQVMIWWLYGHHKEMQYYTTISLTKSRNCEKWANTFTSNGASFQFTCICLKAHHVLWHNPIPNICVRYMEDSSFREWLQIFIPCQYHFLQNWMKVQVLFILKWCAELKTSHSNLQTHSVTLDIWDMWRNKKCKCCLMYN